MAQACCKHSLWECKCQFQKRHFYMRFFAVSFTSWTGWRKTQNGFRSRLTAKNAENRILCGSVFCQQKRTLESNEKPKQHKTCLRWYENGAMGKHCQDRSLGRRQSKSLSLGKLGVHFHLTFFGGFRNWTPNKCAMVNLYIIVWCQL